ncbi:glutathione peroxidase [Vairimorpha necatrix]|uniref:Glutathione peroxidase n=1 Tax=Vairimorpha necatrix TaxID=6039 RepID=A0AAX4JCR9_9MICR
MSLEGSNFYKLSAIDYKDNLIDFSQYKGKMLLITNMASTCGLAKSNLSVLADILTLYREFGLEILIFPCLQYAKDDTDILKKMYEIIIDYSDKFTVFSDINLIGKDIHPVYKHIIKYSKGFVGRFMKWNFAKFIINEKGVIVKMFEPGDRIEVNEKIFKKLLKNKKVQIEEREVLKYETDPYDLENSSDEELFY